MRRVTCTLPDDLVEDIDSISAVLGYSRSAILSLVLSENLPLVLNLVDDIKSVSDDTVILKRARGDSKLELEERYKEVLNGFAMYR